MLLICSKPYYFQLQSSILEALLKQKAAVFAAALKTGDPWQWRLRHLLLLSLQYVCSARSKDANTFPLRVIEVFTSMDHVQQVLGVHGAVHHMSSTYSYLVEKGKSSSELLTM